MAEIGKRIRFKREELGITQEDLAKILGYKNKSTIAKIENGTNDITQSKVLAFANALHTTVAFFMGWDSDSKSQNSVSISVLGRVAAGIPLDAIEEIIDTEEISQQMASDGEYFALKISGDSMEPKISDGDVVIVRKQSDADDGDLVIAMVNGDDAVCKRLKKYADGIALLSNNPLYEPMYFSNKDIAEKPVTILGKVKELRAKF